MFFMASDTATFVVIYMFSLEGCSVFCGKPAEKYGKQFCWI